MYIVSCGKRSIGPRTNSLSRRLGGGARRGLHVVALGVGRVVAEDLLGAVDRQQGAELAGLAGQRHAGEDLGGTSRDGRFMTVSAAAMITFWLPVTSASRPRRHAAATSRTSTYPHRFHLRSCGPARTRGTAGTPPGP